MKYLLIKICIGLALLSFVITKSSSASFTHDESYTYLHYPHESFMTIISHKNWYTNNHLLNTLFMKYSEKLFGNSELALRLPNILLFIVFMLYAHKLFEDKDKLISLCIFILLCSFNLLTDLFGMARGYGLSMGFMMMSMYHLIASLKYKESKHLVLFHVGALLASLSNFTLLTVYVVLLFLYNVVIFVRNKWVQKEGFHFFKTNKIHFIMLIPVMIILYEPVRRLMMYNELDFGGSNGFYKDTVTNLLYTIFGSDISSATLILLQIALTTLVLMSLVLVVFIIRKGSIQLFNNHIGFIVSTLLVVVLPIIFVMQNQLFQIAYPVGRFACFLYPLFMVQLGFFLLFIKAYNTVKIVPVMGVSLAILSATNFIRNANIDKLAQWGYDNNTKKMLLALEEHYEQFHPNHEKEIKLGINWLFEPTINFYRTTRDMHWLAPVDRSGPAGEYDYYYVFNEEVEPLQPHTPEIIKEYEETILLRNNK